jgi:hypothetical protein
MLQFFNDAPATNDPRTQAHAGNGFLMRRGYTVVWLAWQGDLLPGNGRMVLDLPIAPVTGLVRLEYIADRPLVTTFPLSGHASTRSHPRVSLDPREAPPVGRLRYPLVTGIAPPCQLGFTRIERRRAARSWRRHGQPVAADALPQACPHSFDDVCRDEDWYPDRAGEKR